MAATKSKRKFTFPTAFTILFILLFLIALATWIIPAGSYDYNADGEPIPGTYHEVASNPQKLLQSALKGPINGMYGIEDETGNVDVWNYGELFGAIDVALFVLIIGGFLGVTMKTGAINAGIAWVVGKLKGKEKWMFPILMTIFAIGGTSYGMAEETLAFYALIITVMLAAGYDGLTAGALILLGAGIGVLGSTVNPFATGIASGFAGTTISDGLIGRLVLLVVGTIIGIIFVMRYGERVRKDPTKSLIYDAESRERKTVPGWRRRRHGLRRVHRPAQGDPGPLLPGLCGHGLRRDPVGGPGPGHPHLVVVVPGDDGLLPVLRHPDRPDRPIGGKDAGRHLH